MKKAVLAAATFGFLLSGNFAPAPLYAEDKLAASDPDKIFKNYCQWVKDSEEIIRQADAKFGVDIDNKTWLRKDAWSDAKSEKLAKKYEKLTGVTYIDMTLAAEAGNWNQKCTSQEAGLVSVEVEDALAATDDDSSLVQQVLFDYYSNRLKSGLPDPYFDPEKYSTVDCKGMELEKFHFVGCKVFAFFGSRSSYDTYMVAKVDGQTVVTGMSPDPASERIGGLKTFAVSDGKEVKSGHLAKYPVPDAFIRAKQEFNKGATEFNKLFYTTKEMAGIPQFMAILHFRHDLLLPRRSQNEAILSFDGNTIDCTSCLRTPLISVRRLLLLFRSTWFAANPP